MIQDTMTYSALSEKEERERKVKAILSIKFGLVEVNTLSYYRMLSDIENIIYEN